MAATAARGSPGETHWERKQVPFVTTKTYRERATALARFRLIPDQPCANRWAVDHVAGHSLQHTPRGWAWKFDPRVFARPRVPAADVLTRARCPLAIVRGEHSRTVSHELAEYMADLAGPGTPLVELQGAHHHVLLDEPLALVEVVEEILASWGGLSGGGGAR